jgi:DeoR/GlpR family transcriptional regulator of sugar metabolism
MLAKERQNRIEAMVKEHGAVTTGDLVELFEVSIETVRRDLLTMEQRGNWCVCMAVR